MVAPFSLVGDVHAFLALAGRLGHGAVAVDDGQVEELLRLPVPDPDANIIDDVHQCFDVVHLETSAEVAGCSGVGNTLRPEAIGIDLVVAA